MHPVYRNIAFNCSIRHGCCMVQNGVVGFGRKGALSILTSKHSLILLLTVDLKKIWFLSGNSTMRFLMRSLKTPLFLIVLYFWQQNRFHVEVYVSDLFLSNLLKPPDEVEIQHVPVGQNMNQNPRLLVGV